MSDAACQIILTTCPDEAVAQRIATALVSERLAACVNILAVRSVYTWQGKIESANEWQLVIKGRAAAHDAIQSRILSLHPYELPEIIAVPIVAGLPGYLSWLNHPD
jgi:periplasmic divalent cation tolerance protein